MPLARLMGVLHVLRTHIGQLSHWQPGLRPQASALADALYLGTPSLGGFPGCGSAPISTSPSISPTPAALTKFPILSGLHPKKQLEQLLQGLPLLAARQPQARALG